MKIFILLLPLLLTSQTAFSQSSSGSGTRGKIGFYGIGSLKGGMSSFGSADGTTIEKRSLYRYGAELGLGLRVGVFSFGGSAEYYLLKQSTDISEVGDTNASGKQLILSPTAGVTLGRFLLQAKYPFSSTYTMDKESSGGDKVVYSSPASAYGAQLIIRLSGSSFVGAEYTSLSYEESKAGSTTEKLDSDTQINLTSWGIIYGFVF